MNWSIYELIVIPAGIGAIAVFITLAVYGLLFAGFALACPCDDMLLGDQWDKGYVESLAKQCLDER